MFSPSIFLSGWPQAVSCDYSATREFTLLVICSERRNGHALPSPLPERPDSLFIDTEVLDGRPRAATHLLEGHFELRQRWLTEPLGGLPEAIRDDMTLSAHFRR